MSRWPINQAIGGRLKMTNSTDLQAKPKRPYFLVGIGVTMVICIAMIFWFFTLGPGQACRSHVTARAWVDANANGTWDNGEPPLEGVTFHLTADGNPNQTLQYGTDITDWQGNAQLPLPLYPEGCPRISAFAYPDVPPGYRLTTSSTASTDAIPSNGAATFGFTYLPGAPTVTPRPSTPQCTTFTEVGDHLPANRLQSMTLAPDGTLWFVYSYTELAQYRPATNTWKVYPGSDRTAAHVFIKAFAITPDNMLWVAQQSGEVLSFDGTTWKHYTKDNGLLDNEVEAMDATTDGKVWILSKRGISIFDPPQDRWQYLRKPSDQVYKSITPSINGSVILRIADEGFYVVLRPDAEPRKIREDTKDFVYALQADKDGNLWLSTYARLERVDVKTGERQVFDAGTTKERYIAGETRDIGFAADGSVWLASDNGRLPRAYHYIPASVNVPTDSWRYYDQRDGIPDRIIESSDGNSLFQVTIMPDQTLWFREDNTLVHCIFP
jgi:streptogramin lyase